MLFVIIIKLLSLGIAVSLFFRISVVLKSLESQFFAFPYRCRQWHSRVGGWFHKDGTTGKAASIEGLPMGTLLLRESSLSRGKELLSPNSLRLVCSHNNSAALLFT